ncbi:Cobalt-precorrin-6B C(15)-methyltransferase (decarboxylating) [bioreactor metagenome]|uniref:Cobalt-precorrin-6B C(15)-methyltransferase (Decarboxylating) n=1 Tax=bioreactor metagenome TaxID=1076179 RepID=A0A644T0J2_9ZZZZ|nr:precorrin-6Y C5,15-methyltransferase (decarboxylating) subunit CbiT [Negativicutes bacterium]
MNRLGINDEQFIRGNIPMTKQEIRILILANARIRPDDTIIDIGAGTGSISIEAARQANNGQVYAIERQQEGVDLIRANADKFKVNNITVISGSAPQALDDLPLADVIIVGGSGGHLKKILDKSDMLLKSDGRLIITAVTAETLYNTLTIMQSNPNYSVSASGVQVTRIKQVGHSNMFEALNPIYIIVCTKGGCNDKTR